MGRKTQAQIDAEAADSQKKIDDAVEKRVQELVPVLAEQLLAKLAGAREEAGTVGVAEADRGLISELITGMAKLSDPQNKHRILSPEVLRGREEAKERMTNLLIQAHARSDMPVYALRHKVYLNEVKIEPQYQDAATKKMMDQHINWPGIPNLAMVPVNETAKAIYAEFQLSIGSAGPKKVTSAPWVLSGKQIFRGRNPDVDDVGNLGSDPRLGMPGHGPDLGPDEVRVLGTVAKPAQMAGGARPGAAADIRVGR